MKKGGARPVVVALVAAALAATVAGCGGDRRAGAASPDAGAMVSTRLLIDAPAKTNGGAMLYMMVRVVDDTFAVETYQDAAVRLFSAERDKQILDSRPIFPGEKVTVTVEAAAKSDIAVYFFFTAPQGTWRKILHTPLPETTNVELGEHHIEHLSSRPR